MVKRIETIVCQVLAWDDASRHEPDFKFEDMLYAFMEGVAIANPSILPEVSTALKTASQLPATVNGVIITEMADILEMNSIL